MGRTVYADATLACHAAEFVRPISEVMVDAISIQAD
jgi:hypothetical protein